jgi:hypothetical protein
MPTATMEGPRAPQKCGEISPDPTRSKILLRSRRDPLPKHGVQHRHVGRVERVHDRLDPHVVHVEEEVLDGVLGGGRGGVEACEGGVCARAPRAGGGDAKGRARPGDGEARAGRAGGQVRGGEEHEPDVGGGEEGGDVRVGEAVDRLEVPGAGS